MTGLRRFIEVVEDLQRTSVDTCAKEIVLRVTFEDAEIPVHKQTNKMYKNITGLAEILNP